MPGWQVTAKTIYCEAVEDEVTILVYRDGSTRCTGFKKYTEPNDMTRQVLKAKKKSSRHPLRCEGERCPRVTQYKEKILAEEKQ
jgi:hypothetical protein